MRFGDCQTDAQHSLNEDCNFAQNIHQKTDSHLGG